MKSNLQSLAFNTKFLWYLGCTPKQLQGHFTNWTLAFTPTPTLRFLKNTTVAVSSNGWTQVQFYKGTQKIALNTTPTGGIVIQVFEPNTNLWTEVARLKNQSFEAGAWCKVVKSAVKARIKTNIQPINESALGAFNE